MDAQELRQKLIPWARQTIIYRILLNEQFDANPFEAPAKLRHVSATATTIANEIWIDAKKESDGATKLAMVFVDKVFAWISDREDKTVQVP